MLKKDIGKKTSEETQVRIAELESELKVVQYKQAMVNCMQRMLHLEVAHYNRVHGVHQRYMENQNIYVTFWNRLMYTEPPAAEEIVPSDLER